jgi:hypothetical protein
MNRRKRRIVSATLALGAVWLVASRPAIDSPLHARAGLWEVSRSATGAAAERVCLADPMLLAQWEHRGGACTRVVISQEGLSAKVQYTCTGGGLGQSEITLLTPRSLRVNTQGIADGLPFAYALHARRIGNCPGR